jgi:hypothetical protein
MTRTIQRDLFTALEMSFLLWHPVEDVIARMRDIVIETAWRHYSTSRSALSRPVEGSYREQNAVDAAVR